MNRQLADAVKRRSGGRCEAQVVCGGRRAVHMHHRRRAGRLDFDANLLHLCLKCHEWIHANPAESYLGGLLVHSWADPATVPVPGLTLSPIGRSSASVLTPPSPDAAAAGTSSPSGGELARGVTR